MMKALFHVVILIFIVYKPVWRISELPQKFI